MEKLKKRLPPVDSPIKKTPPKKTRLSVGGTSFAKEVSMLRPGETSSNGHSWLLGYWEESWDNNGMKHLTTGAGNIATIHKKISENLKRTTKKL